MIDFLREHQLDLMLVLAGICFAVTICGLVSKTTRIKKVSLLIMGIFATLLMIADRYAYIYRGDESDLGYHMVRICNFVTFLCPLMIIHSFNRYLTDFIKTKTDSECRDIYLAGLLHDVGKIGIPDNIINKDGRLTDEEFAVIKTHPAIGAGILKKINIAPFIEASSI